MDEILLVDKSINWTSFDVVGKIRLNIFKSTGFKVKVGHAGTLDPLATGLLIVLIGKATKKQDSFMKQDKVYEVEIKLGEISTTLDAEGDKTKISENIPELEKVEKALKSFIGEIQQIPPAYSAIKIAGQRAYKLAREGKEVIIEPRTISVYSIENVKYHYPYIRFSVHVSSGTYIRTLAQDIGQKLGTGAYMSNLRRISIGEYSVENAKSVENISEDLIRSFEKKA